MPNSMSLSPGDAPVLGDDPRPIAMLGASFRHDPYWRSWMSQALQGIRVVDMTHNQAGPACAQMLGFLGADVIKLEEPKGGDIARVNMRDQKNSDSLFFLILNANKRSLTLNLKTDVGK